jgi:hypothetical protein
MMAFADFTIAYRRRESRDASGERVLGDSKPTTLPWPVKNDT